MLWPIIRLSPWATAIAAWTLSHAPTGAAGRRLGLARSLGDFRVGGVTTGPTTGSSAALAIFDLDVGGAGKGTRSRVPEATPQRHRLGYRY